MVAMVSYRSSINHNTMHRRPASFGNFVLAGFVRDLNIRVSFCTRILNVIRSMPFLVVDLRFRKDPADAAAHFGMFLFRFLLSTLRVEIPGLRSF